MGSFAVPSMMRGGWGEVGAGRPQAQMIRRRPSIPQAVNMMPPPNPMPTPWAGAIGTPPPPNSLGMVGAASSSAPPPQLPPAPGGFMGPAQRPERRIPGGQTRQGTGWGFMANG